MLLIYILIVLFIFLLGYQTYLAILPTKLIENLENSKQEEYKPYNLNDPNNALILSQQNAGNIEVLKGRIDEFDGINNKVTDMQQSMNLMQTQIDGLVQQQANFAQELAGSTPPEITGTELVDEDNI
jgi:hypothetical protein